MAFPSCVEQYCHTAPVEEASILADLFAHRCSARGLVAGLTFRWAPLPVIVDALRSLSNDRRQRLVAAAAALAQQLRLMVVTADGVAVAYFDSVACLFPPIPFDGLPEWLLDSMAESTGRPSAHRRKHAYQAAERRLTGEFELGLKPAGVPVQLL
jgi:hypothetical protein